MSGASEEADRGPQISEERRAILGLVDEKIAYLSNTKKVPDNDETAYARQVLQAMRSDIRQCLDQPEGEGTA